MTRAVEENTLFAAFLNILPILLWILEPVPVFFNSHSTAVISYFFFFTFFSYYTAVQGCRGPRWSKNLHTQGQCIRFDGASSHVQTHKWKSIWDYCQSQRCPIAMPEVKKRNLLNRAVPKNNRTTDKATRRPLLASDVHVSTLMFHCFVLFFFWKFVVSSRINHPVFNCLCLLSWLAI